MVRVHHGSLKPRCGLSRLIAALVNVLGGLAAGLGQGTPILDSEYVGLVGEWMAG